MIGAALITERILGVVIGGTWSDEIIQFTEVTGGKYLPYASGNRLVLIIGHDSGLSGGHRTADNVRTGNGRTAADDPTDTLHRVLPLAITAWPIRLG